MVNNTWCWTSGTNKVKWRTIRNMPRKNKSYHEVEKKINSLLESIRENLENAFRKKLPSFRDLLGAAAEPEEGCSILGNERAMVRCQKQWGRLWAEWQMCKLLAAIRGHSVRKCWSLLYCFWRHPGRMQVERTLYRLNSIKKHQRGPWTPLSLLSRGIQTKAMNLLG